MFATIRKQTNVSWHQKLSTTQIYEEVDRKTIENDIKTIRQ